MAESDTLRARLVRRPIVMAPGVYDPFTALVATQVGFATLYPTLPASELEAIGFALVIFPGAIVRALGFMANEFYGSLNAHGSSERWRTRMLDFDGINQLVGTPETIALGRRYALPQKPEAL